MVYAGISPVFKPAAHTLEYDWLKLQIVKFAPCVTVPHIPRSGRLPQKNKERRKKETSLIVLRMCDLCVLQMTFFHVTTIISNQRMNAFVN